MFLGKVSPGIKSSAAENKGNGATGHGHGNRYLARVLGAAVGASRAKTLLGERYRRLAGRRGK